nr:MAG TPA: hypothetical protein [Caudoviricetes sp.]
MAEYTKYLRLMKPQGNEYYNVENFNHNAELIDKETEKLNNAVTKIQEGATREKAGIVQFGTEEGKALEGMMLARLAGCIGYGGDIQIAGVKDINYIYYDRNTRKMYKCLNQNSDVSANVANFIPLDNNSLLERLENLIKTKTFKISTSEMENIMTFQTSGGNYVLCEKGIRNFKQKLGIPQNSTIVSVMPSQSYGYFEYVTYDENDDSMFAGLLIYSTIQNRTVSILVKYI